MKVLVTGSSSHLAHAVLPLLCANDSIARVTGVDIVAPHFSHKKFQAERCDIRAPRLKALLEGQDALVHLAFVVLRGRMRETEMMDINVTGSYRLFRAAQNAGVKRLIHLSSAAVYGQGVCVAEGAPIAPLSGFRYGEHKAQLERFLEMDVPECVRLRPHVILGPHAQPLLLQLLSLPLYPALAPPYPRLQCVHEDDVARAVLLAIERDVRGPLNLAADDSFSYREIIQRRHGFAFPLPLGAARAGLRTIWRITGWGGEPGWIEGLARTLTLDCQRATTELGWRGLYNTAATLTDSLS